MKTPDILQAVQPVISAFDELSIPYYIGGSIASSVYGIARATIDIDLVADIKSIHVSSLKKILENNYYIDEDMIFDAIKRFSSFNLIHLETMIKIDVFIHKVDFYSKQTINRKRKDTLEKGKNALKFYFSSPEDIIINKLQWYDMGHRVSERQWLDIIGVLKVQNKNLDKKYIKDWCIKLKIIDLLKAACKDAGIEF